jgi:hypothetical protein
MMQLKAKDTHHPKESVPVPMTDSTPKPPIPEVSEK